MEKAGVALPLLIFPAIQTEALLYVGGSMDDQMRGRPVPHLKARMTSILASMKHALVSQHLGGRWKSLVKGWLTL